MHGPREHWRRIRINNAIDHLNRKIRRLTRAVGTFADGKSMLTLDLITLPRVSGSAALPGCADTRRVAVLDSVPLTCRKVRKKLDSTPKNKDGRFYKQDSGKEHASALATPSSRRARRIT